MLLLTIIHLLKPSERLEAFKMIRNRTKEVIKVGSAAEKPKRKGYLNELGQLWHLLVLMILDDNAVANQKKAIFGFLTSKTPSSEKLLSNPFYWKGNTIPVMNINEVIELCTEIIECRDMFEMMVIEEVLELPS